MIVSAVGLQGKGWRRRMFISQTPALLRSLWQGSRMLQKTSVPVMTMLIQFMVCLKYSHPAEPILGTEVFYCCLLFLCLLHCVVYCVIICLVNPGDRGIRASAFVKSWNVGTCRKLDAIGRANQRAHQTQPIQLGSFPIGLNSNCIPS